MLFGSSLLNLDADESDFLFNWWQTQAFIYSHAAVTTLLLDRCNKASQTTDHKSY